MGSYDRLWNSSKITLTVYGAAEVYGVPGILGGADDASGVGGSSGSQHRNSSISSHTVYGAAEVYGVPGISGGAGDASGVARWRS